MTAAVETKKPEAKKTTTETKKTEQKKQTDQQPKKQTLVSTITEKFLQVQSLYEKQHGTLVSRIESAKNNIERIQGQLTKNELQLSNLSKPSITNALIDPLCSELLKLMPEYSGYEMVGPMGIQQAVTISFQPKVSSKDEKKNVQIKSITFVTKPDGDGIGVRDYSKDTKEHAPGSIAHASGMNHPVVMFPDGVELDWILKWVK